MDPTLFRAWLTETAQSTGKKFDSSEMEEQLQLLLEGCHPKQREFVLDPGRRICALVARGGGKTTGMRARFVRRMLTTRRARCLFIATTRPQAEEFMWEPLKELCDELGIAAKFSETKLRCTFPNGSTLRLVGADDKKEIGKLRGQPFHEVGIDEAASYNIELLKELIFRILGPRLGDFAGSTLVLYGTPSHLLHGLFYDVTRNGSTLSRHWEERQQPEFANWLKWSFHRWTLQDGAETIPALARLWAEALREKEANQWSDDNPSWLREYLGFWAADDTESVFSYRPHLDDGHPWNQWDPERTREGFAVLPEEFSDWSYAYGMDLGHKDPFSLQVLAWSPTDPKKKLYHVYEFNKVGMHALTIAELLLGEDPKDGSTWPNFDRLGGCIGITGWPDGIVADTAGVGGALLDDLSKVYGIKVNPSEKSGKHGIIELTNGDLIDGRLVILKGSQLEEQLLTLQWAVDDWGKLREHRGMRNDCTDALIYARRIAAHLLSQEAAASKPYFSEPNRTDPTKVPGLHEQRGEFDYLMSEDSDWSM